MFTLRSALCAVLAVLWAGPALANNTFFLPGDSFFYARLNLKSVNAIQKVDSPIFQYGSHWNGGFGCGSIGYWSLRINGMPKATRAAIRDAFKSFQKQIEADPNLSGKMSLFVYAADYDWKKYGLGLQYNEKWVEESVSFGAMRKHVRLESFVNRPHAITRNWRDSAAVDPLPTKRPKVRGQAVPKAPVEIDSAKCKILIIPNRKFGKYLSPFEGGEVIEIVGGKLTRFIGRNGKWKPLQ